MRKILLLLAIQLSHAVLHAQQTPEARLATAEKCIEEGKYDCALPILNQLILEDSGYAQAIFARSWIYNEQGNYAAALNDELHLTRLFPNRSANWRNAAWHALLVGSNEPAIVYAKTALEKGGSDYRNALTLAHAFAAVEDMEQLDFYYKMAAEYMVSKEDIGDAMAQLDTLSRRGIFPFRTNSLQRLFDETLAGYAANNAATQALFKARQLTRDGYDEGEEEVVRQKDAFIEQEVNQEYSRYFVLRDFLWDVGKFELEHRNKLKALDLYFPRSITASSILKDTIRLVRQLFQLGDYEWKDNLPGANRLLQTALSWSRSCRKIGDDTRILLFLKISDNYRQQRNYDSALSFAREGYVFAQGMADRSFIPLATNRLYIVFSDLKQFDSVFYYHELSRKLERDRSDASSITLDDNLCKLLYRSGAYSECAAKSVEYASVYQTTGSEDVAQFSMVAGMSFFQLGKYKEAEGWLRKSLTLYKQYLERNGITDPRRVPSITMKNAYQFLKRIALNRKKADVAEIFELSEDSKANNLFVSFTGKNFVSGPAQLKQVQRTLNEDELLLSYNISAGNKTSYLVAVSRQSAELIRIPVDSVVGYYQRYGLGAWIRQITEISQFLYDRQPESYDRADLEWDFYRDLTLAGAACQWFKKGILAGELSRGLNVRTRDTVNAGYRQKFAEGAGRLLYQLLFSGIEPMLKSKKKLIIIQDQFTTSIPLEVLKNEEGKFIGEQYSIAYLPSFSIAEKLGQRNQSGDLSMIALGNPDYRGFQPKKTGRAYDLAALGMASWGDLPATARELSAIRELLPAAQVVQQSAVTESSFKEMAAAGKLNGGVIHFAVHGLNSINDPQDNSLVLTEPPASREDGFLQFAEITDLKIRARLVCLSACETAEAVASLDIAPNLVTAFLIAGAGGVIATTWKVDDEATAMFMGELYGHIYNDRMLIIDALQKTRQSFISGKYGDKYKNLYYWGPFKYSGVVQ
ncbi:MAG TPA: CHAT domain-containing protein [Chitinophagaceae bacterium]